MIISKDAEKAFDKIPHPFMIKINSPQKVGILKKRGIPWRSSGQDSALSLLRAQVQSLVGELRSHKPCSTAKKKKSRYRGNIPQHNKGHKPTANIILNGEMQKAFPLKSGTRQGFPLLPLLSAQYWKSYPQQSDKKKK